MRLRRRSLGTLGLTLGLIASACSTDSATSVSTGTAADTGSTSSLVASTVARHNDSVEPLPLTDELLLVALLTEDAAPADMVFTGPFSANLETCADSLSPNNGGTSYVDFGTDDSASGFSQLMLRVDDPIALDDAIELFEFECIESEMGVQAETERTQDGEFLVSRINVEDQLEIGIAYRLTDGALAMISFRGPDLDKMEAHAKSLLPVAIERLAAIRTQGYDPADVPSLDERFDFDS